MNIPNARIIPISQARSKLSNLLNETKGSNYYLLTKGGKAQAALIDIEYLEKLEKDVEKIYQKTFIDPKLLPLTRKFSNKEIAEWLKEDQL